MYSQLLQLHYLKGGTFFLLFIPSVSMHDNHPILVPAQLQKGWIRYDYCVDIHAVAQTTGVPYI